MLSDNNEYGSGLYAEGGLDDTNGVRVPGQIVNIYGVDYRDPAKPRVTLATFTTDQHLWQTSDYFGAGLDVSAYQMPADDVMYSGVITVEFASANGYDASSWAYAVES